ncbi:MAG: UDP-N-acetylglucosamine--N-acetylmuramyl-(pentapeptide) pyrophosphoryl-undecaprenol N-acetylglucosamine transferase [Caldilineaceae bacterium]
MYPALAVAALLSPNSVQRSESAAQRSERIPQATSLNPASDVAGQPDAPHEVLWVGSSGGMEEELVRRAGIAYRGVDTGQLRGKNPLTAARNASKMLSGIQQSRQILDGYEPDVCMVTGGYVCAPVVVACRQKRVPVLIYLPDMAPGSAIRWLSRLAQRVAVTLPDAASYFGGTVEEGGKAVVTGYPVRPELLAAAEDRQQARLRLDETLRQPAQAPATAGEQEHAAAQDDGALPLLLVWGGSQGSRSINLATWDSLAHLLPHMHVVHVVGVRDWDMAQPIIEAARVAPEWQPEWTDRYHAVAYLHEAMPYALAAADLTVARAGASVLGEFTVAGLPSILVPLPIAGVGQQLNARALQDHGAAVVIDDDDLSATLAATVNGLLEDEERLRAMGNAARSLANPRAAQNIVDELVRLAAGADDGSLTEDNVSPVHRTEA